MFNGPTNRLLEKTNEELSLMSRNMEERLLAIEDKFAQPSTATPSAKVNPGLFVICILLLTGILLMQVYQVKKMQQITEKNNQVLKDMTTALSNNASAFESLQKVNSDVMRVNGELENTLTEVQKQNNDLLMSGKKLTYQYRELLRQLSPGEAKQSNTLTSSIQ